MDGRHADDRNNSACRGLPSSQELRNALSEAQMQPNGGFGRCGRQ
jgi:hypothetical protein